MAKNCAETDEQRIARRGEGKERDVNCIAKAKRRMAERRERQRHRRDQNGQGMEMHRVERAKIGIE